jgi:hypothetical protein
MQSMSNNRMLGAGKILACIMARALRSSAPASVHAHQMTTLLAGPLAGYVHVAGARPSWLLGAEVEELAEDVHVAL